jgi:hypothetical protein
VPVLAALEWSLWSPIMLCRLGPKPLAEALGYATQVGELILRGQPLEISMHELGLAAKFDR